MIVSIIIPSYNCGQWLDRAVTSAFSLNKTHIEVIVVDDGSTDDTPSICGVLKHKYPALKVIRQLNGGLSAARNTGLDAATGTFIILLDADDELVGFDVSTITDTDADVLRIGVEEVTIEGTTLYWLESYSESEPGPEYLQRHLKADTLYIPSCAYVYRRSFLQENDLRFKNGLIHEDNLFTIQALVKSASVAATSTIVYRYIRRDNSITLTQNFASSKRRILSYQQIVDEIIDMANQHTEVDLWLWAVAIIESGWTLALTQPSRRLAWPLLLSEFDLYFKYQAWGVWRHQRNVLWRLRRAVGKFVYLR